MRAATLCNRAEFDAGQSSAPIMQRVVLGDASEAAILKFVELTQCHGSVTIYKREHPKLIELPFNSTTKYQVRNAFSCYLFFLDFFFWFHGG